MKINDISGYFNLHDGNSMNAEERIYQAFAVDGNVEVGDKVYNNKDEFRKFLKEEGYI